MRCRWYVLFLALLFVPSVRANEESEAESKPKLSAETFAGIPLRNIGPALMSGRIADIAIDPERPNVWYVAVGSGNVSRTSSLRPLPITLTEGSSRSTSPTSKETTSLRLSPRS